MSYGRSPYYIWSNGKNIYFNDGPLGVVSHDAMAQFIARLAARGDGEINEWIQRGKELCPDLKDNLAVTVTGGFAEDEPSAVKKDPLWIRRAHYIFEVLSTAGMSMMQNPRSTWPKRENT